MHLSIGFYKENVFHSITGLVFGSNRAWFCIGPSRALKPQVLPAHLQEVADLSYLCSECDRHLLLQKEATGVVAYLSSSDAGK
jgi:hypothetical protein